MNRIKMEMLGEINQEAMQDPEMNVHQTTKHSSLQILLIRMPLDHRLVEGHDQIVIQVQYFIISFYYSNMMILIQKSVL